MGVPFSIDPGIGPIIHEPVRDVAAVRALRIVDPQEATPDLFEAIRLIRSELDGRAAVLGFAGAPFTVASYLIEGRPTKDFARSKALMYGQPLVWHELMETLTEVTIRYLRAQIAAGVEAVQLFDSWVGALGAAEYREHVLPYVRRIFDAIRGTVPTIHFGTSTAHLLEDMAGAGSDAVSVDWRLRLDQAWARIGERAIQGNLDPTICLAPWPVVERETLRVLDEAAARPGHIFNLGHGVIADTPSDTLRRVVELVHDRTATAA
jgi:uroporphyrinogen decarboxylase